MARLAMLSVFAVAMAAGGAIADAQQPKTMYVQTPEASAYAMPGPGYPVIARMKKGDELLELQRIGPGRHKIFKQDFSEEEVAIPADGGLWANVGVVGSGGKVGWVRARDIGPDLPLDVKRAREKTEMKALMAAIDELARAPCATELYFTRLFGAWYVKAPGTSAVEVERWLGRTDKSYRLLKLVDRLGGGRNVPMLTVLRATGEC